MKTTKSGSKEGKGGDTPSERIEMPSDWRAETLARIRILIKQADPEVVEEVKWRKPSNSMAGVPVWSHAGMICTGETYKNVVKMTFAKGAALPDPSGLFNSSLEGNIEGCSFVSCLGRQKFFSKLLCEWVRRCVWCSRVCLL